MSLRYYCPHWGNQLPFITFCQRVKQAGYDGIEMDLPIDLKENNIILATLKEQGLSLIGQYWQSIEKNFPTHLKNYSKYLYHLASANPVLINAQTGKDYFSFEQNMQLVALARKISDETGVEIVHETHRGKFLFNIPVFKRCAQEDKSIKITLDISHWCNVHESFLEDQKEGVQLAINRTRHLHARIGNTQSAQVNDPRAPEWKETVGTFLGWWDRVILTHSQKKKNLTITTEFGPVPYMPTAPYTQKPLADQWELNLYMLQLLKSRYGV